MKCKCGENRIVDKIEFVYPIKNGIENAKKEARDWALKCLKNDKANL